VSDTGQFIDEKVGSGTRADTDNALGVEFGLDKFQRSNGCLVFEGVLRAADETTYAINEVKRWCPCWKAM
jgi:hypothetical protein